MECVKRCVMLLAAAAVVRCGPQSGSQYLPPKPPGYTYNRPSVPFPLPPVTQQPLPPVTQPPVRPVQPVRPPVVPIGPGYPTGPAQPPAQPQYPSQPPAQPQYPSQPPAQPQYPSQPPASDDHDHHHDHVHVPGMPYDFNYAVKDDYHGNDFSRNEVSDGDEVRGEYRVQLPDGRLQIVRYTADWATGFHADVSYEGEAQYPPPSEYKRPQTFPPQQPQQEGYSYDAPPGGAAL